MAASPDTTRSFDSLRAAALRSPWRFVAVAALAANAAIHAYLTPMHLEEAPYIGWLFVALSVACVVAAGALLVRDNPAVWVASGAVSLLALGAFVASRTVGLPQIADEVGEWSDPLGTATIVVEVVTVAAAAAAVALGVQRRRPVLERVDDAARPATLSTSR